MGLGQNIEIPIDILGCTDPNANNYNPNANKDDGSCTYGNTPIVFLPFTGKTQTPPILGPINPGVSFDFCDTDDQNRDIITHISEVKFRKNLESGDKSYYNNLNLTVRLDRMIKYMMAESSVDNRGLLPDINFDDKLKSPFADFYNDIIVVTTAETNNGKIVTSERKPVKFKIGDGSKKYLDYFKKFFNINQTVMSSNPLISPPPSDYLEIEKVNKTQINTSPLVLCLSSYDNRALSGFNENREFSNNLIEGAGRGGMIIYPRTFGYLINISDTNKTKGIRPDKINNVTTLITDERLFYKVTDIEGKTFSYDDTDGIIPSVLIDNGELRVFTGNESVLNTSQLIFGMSEIDKEHSFQNQYLKLFNRELIKEEVQSLGYFILNNDGIKNFTNNSFPLFKIEKEVYVGSTLTPVVYSTTDPLYLEVKTDNQDDKHGQLIVNFKIDFEREITGSTLTGNPPLDNLKNLNLSNGSYVSESFVVY